jgi:hypothetical protein
MKYFVIILLIFCSVLTSNSQDFSIQQEITPDSAINSLLYGSSIVMNSNYAVVGQLLYTDTTFSPLQILKKQDGNWIKVIDITAKLKFSANCRIPINSVSMNENLMVIGSSGYWCNIYENKPTQYVSVISLDNTKFDTVARLADPDSAFGYFGFGSVVCNTDSIIAVRGHLAYSDGSITYGYPGAVYIFQLMEENQWEFTQKINSPANYDFGQSIAINNNTLFIAAPSDIYSKDTSKVYIYERKEDKQYELQHEIIAEYFEKDDYRSFGNRIQATDSLLIVSETKYPYDSLGNNEMTGSGAAHIYALGADGQWNKNQTLVAYDRDWNAYFGHASFSDGILAISSFFYSGGVNYSSMGKLYCYTRENSKWVLKQSITAPDSNAYDNFGASFCIYKNNLLVSSPNRKMPEAETIIPSVGKLYYYSTDKLSSSKTNSYLSDNKCIIYPNPVKDYFYINYPYQNSIQLKIYSLTGKIVMELTHNSNAPIDVQDLDAGMYIYKAYDGKTFQTGKFIIR